MKNEIWKLIEDYDGYEVSSFGRIRSWKYTNSPHLLKLLKVNGYFQVALCENGVATHFNVHRLVCKAFHPNPYNYKIANHIDGDKHNNNADNLEWCTQQENIQGHFVIKHDIDCPQCIAYHNHMKVIERIRNKRKLSTTL
jgi:hypothetical protein